MSDARGGFAPYFSGRQFFAVGDEQLMRQAGELRFQVYCEECSFLANADYPTGLESDEFDAGSEHFCSLNLQDEIVGYVRLVHASDGGRFPFQAHCVGLFAETVLPDPALAGEISRLMVRKDYRRRRNDALAGVTVPDETKFSQDRRNESPQILLSMYRAMYHYSLAHHIRYWYAAMERPLARALLRFGFEFHQIGPETDYYGPVAPYLADLREIELKVEAAAPALMAWLRQVGD